MFPDRREITPDQQKELARSTGAYQRLKTKFGGIDLADGLEGDALTLGDLFDIAMLYSVLTQRGLERLHDNMRDELTYAVEHAVGKSLPVERTFTRTVDQLKRTRDINSLNREDHLFDLTINLNDLIEGNPFSIHHTEFEVAHYPGGILIQPVSPDKAKYRLLLQDLNMSDKPFYADIFRETGLPVASNIPSDRHEGF